MRAFMPMVFLASCAVDVPATEGGGASSPGFESQGQKLQGQKLQGQKLQGQKLQGAQLEGRELLEMTLTGTTLSGLALVPAESIEGSLTPCATPQTGLDRNCGWELGGIGACLAGAPVTVGSGACGLGSCGGDSMIRVCGGRQTCGAETAIAANDDACGGPGSSVTFACPASGDYTVLVGNHHSQHQDPIDPAASTGQFPLTYPVSGMDFIGATLYGVDAAGHDIEFLVDDIEIDPEDSSGDILLYTLRYRDPATGGWDNACVPDGDGVQKAIPMHGIWDDAGARQESDTLFTFGCVSGVLAKCVRWGYKPWTVNGLDLVPYHQACTRMARADYCGDGVSHTFDGTLIDVWDTIGIQQRTPGSGMLFDASWVEDGAYCVSKWRWNADGVLLLTECPWKLRLPTLQDLLAGCLLKLTTRPRSAIRTNNDSYVGISVP